MAELETPVVETPVSAPTPPAAPPKKSLEKQRKRKKRIRNSIIALIVLAGLGVGTYFLYQFLNKEEPTDSQLQTGMAEYSSIKSTVQGEGSARAKEQAAIALTQGGTVQEVLVNVGDKVTAGQPLYVIRSQAAEDAVTAAEEAVNAALEQVASLQKDLANIEKERADLTVRAPFAGKLVEVSEFVPGAEVGKGSAVATLVNDKKLKLSLYFSYAYDGSIYAGQSVDVSIPSVMRSFTGKVEAVNKVHYISPEGADHFEAVLVFDNPGTLTEGMVATASLSAADGTPIYPYQNGEIKFYETRKIVTEASGPLVSSKLLRYSDVRAGEVLLTLSAETLDETLRSKQKEITTASDRVIEVNKKLEEAHKALENFNATAPIDGTVTSCTLVPEAEVKAGDTVITISNDTAMVVDITVDDRNISFVQPGMMVELNAYDGNVFMGIVTKIDMSLGGDSMGSGMTNYPVTLEVDNMGGTLMPGMWLNYSFVASQSDDCIVVPMQSVKYVSDVDGNTASVVFIQAESKPENTVDIDIPPADPGSTPMYPSESDGFYPVPVTTGLSDNYNVEITSGLTGGETVFMNYYVNRMGY